MLNISNIILLGGRSKRFFDAGYDRPKAFLKVGKSIMIKKVTSSLSLNNELIFLCQKKIAKRYSLIGFLKKNYPKFKIKYINKVTNGQATSCIKALELVKKKQAPFYVFSTDSYFKFNKKKINSLLKKKNIIIFVKKVKKIKNHDYNKYGWVKLNKNKPIGISCKKVISKKPWEDLSIVGSFGFPSKKIYEKYYKILIKNKIKVNNEYYIDSICDLMIKNNEKVLTISVNNFMDFGDPILYEKNKQS